MPFFLLFLLFALAGCAGQKAAEFQGQRPDFDLAAYFEGKTIAYGMFEDRFNNLRRQFKVLVVGYEEDGELVLEEEFLYADGETQRRVWRITITKKSPNRFTGRAGDIVGTAEGRLYGNALRWRYTLDLKVGEEDTWRVGFDDWMYLQPDGVLLNRARVTRFGFEIGEITLAFVKPGITAQPETFELVPR